MAKNKVIPVRKWSSPIELQLRNAVCGRIANVSEHNRVLFDYSTSAAVARVELNDGAFSGVVDDDLVVDPKFHEWGSGDFITSLYGNVYVSSYKIDLFIVDNLRDACLAIECDGHDYHDRTKQQASSDRARDRALLRLDIPTIRFTGSDIHHDADGCAKDVLEILDARSARSFTAANIAGWRHGYDQGRESEEARCMSWARTSAWLIPEAS